jgi:predicted GTPase
MTAEPTQGDEEELRWTPTTIDAYAERIRGSARENFERDGELIPAAMIYATKNAETMEDQHSMLVVGAAGMEDDAAKDHFTKALRDLCKKLEAVAILFVVEAWSVQVTKDEDIRKWRGNAHKHPDREEIVIATLECARRGTKQWIAKITRDENEKPALGEWREATEFTKGGGRFANLLPMVS